MNPNEEYNFTQEVDQHGRSVPTNFFDRGEWALIERFIQIVQDLQPPGDRPLTMVELGSNQAYYSCLFNAIHRKEDRRTILVEPYDLFMIRSKRHFEINGFEAEFDRRSIGPKWVAWRGYEFEHGQVTIDELLQEYNIETLDVLHSDIDGSELTMLEGADESLRDKRISTIFLLTHSEDLHRQCLDTLLGYGYKIFYEDPRPNIGTDRLIIALA